MNKKLKFMVGAVLAVGLFAVSLAALAQQHQAQSFLGVNSLYLTNTANATNLLSPTSAGTNFQGMAFTNLNRLVVINTTSGQTNVTASRINPFKDVALWALRDGSPPYFSNTNTLNFFQSFATLSITMTGGSGSSANTCLLVFTPVYDGDNEATAAGEQWSAAFTPTTSLQTLVTNVPLHRWPGAKKLRLVRGLSTDTDPSSGIIVREINLNGFVP